MERLGQFWVFWGFVVLGAFAVVVAYSFRSVAGTILVVLLPLAVLWLWAAADQGARNIRALLKSVAWWEWLWLLLFLSGLVFRVRNDSVIEGNPLDAWALYRVALVGTTAVVLSLHLVPRHTSWMGSLFRGLVGALTMYAAVSAVSTLWSVYPAWTFYKSLEYLVDVAALAAILATVQSTETYRTFLNWTWALFGLLVASFWLGALVWPTLAFEPSTGLLSVRLAGVVPAVDANSVGEFGAILAIVALSRLLTEGHGKHQRAWYYLVYAVGLVTLIFSQTRSAVGGFLLGVLLVLFFTKGKGITALAVSAGAIALSVASVRTVLWRAISRGQSEEMFKSATGRVEGWSLAWHQILVNPIVGAGAYTSRFTVLAKLGETKTSSVLNTFVDVALGGGIVGLIPVLIAFVGTWWLLTRLLRDRSLKSSERRLAVEAVGVLSVVSVRSFITTNLIWHPALQFLVVLGYAEFLRRRYRQSSETVMRAGSHHSVYRRARIGSPI